MQSEESSHHGLDEVQTSAESLPQHAQVVPLVQTAPSAPHNGRRTPRTLIKCLVSGS